MVREMREETGIETTVDEWTLAIVSATSNMDECIFYFLCVRDRIPAYDSITDEKVQAWSLQSVLRNLPVLDNMRWVLPLAMSDNVCFPVFVAKKS